MLKLKEDVVKVEEVKQEPPIQEGEEEAAVPLWRPGSSSSLWLLSSSSLSAYVSVYIMTMTPQG